MSNNPIIIDREAITLRFPFCNIFENKYLVIGLHKIKPANVIQKKK